MSTEIELVPFALGDGSGVMVCCAEDAMDIVTQRDARIAELEAENERFVEALEVAAGKAVTERENLREELAALKAQSSTQEWPQQECPVTGAITDVDPADMGAQQPSAGVAQGIDIDAAAKALAQCMDYPWDFMPERGREAMREHVRSVIGAARLNPCRAQAVPDDLRAAAENCSFVMRYIGSMEPDEIDGDNVELRFEDEDGRDTGADASIVEYAEKVADLLDAMLAAAPSAQQEED